MKQRSTEVPRALRRHAWRLLALCIVVSLWLLLSSSRPGGLELALSFALFIGIPSYTVFLTCAAPVAAWRHRKTRGAALLALAGLVSPLMVYGAYSAALFARHYGTPHHPSSFFTSERRETLTALAERLLASDVDDLNVGDTRSGRAPESAAMVETLRRAGFSQARVTRSEGTVEFRARTSQRGRLSSKFGGQRAYVYVSPSSPDEVGQWRVGGDSSSAPRATP